MIPSRFPVLLRREGWSVNLKRVHRLYRLVGLQLRTMSLKRKVAAKQRVERPVATAPNQVWAMDFMADQLFDGRRIRLLTIVDAFTRLCPGIDVRHTYKGSDVVETLRRVTAVHRIPAEIRVDNGPSSCRRTSTCGPGAMA